MRILFATVFLLCTPVVPLAASAQADPEADEAKFVRLTNQLEQDPLGDADKSIRSWLLQWAVDSKDITVTVCDILGTVSGDDLPYSGIYTTQMMFGNAAYQIGHPDKRGEILATQLAGARSSLNAYTSILASHPESRNAHLDDLIKEDKAGNLEKYLAPVIADKCNKSGGA